MRFKVEVEIRPFPVPETVGLINVFETMTANSDVRLKLKDLDFATLSKLCDDFRASVFEKAGLDKI